MAKLCFIGAHGPNNTGNGRLDPGATSAGVTERNMSEGMVSRLMLDAKKVGYNVMLFDGPLSLQNRVSKARSSGSDLCISLHMNSGSAAASGVEALIGPRANAHAKKFAGEVCAKISKACGLPNRGVKVRSDLAVTSLPNACLVEMAFVSNPGDRAKYNAKSAVPMELAIFNAINKTFGASEKSTPPRIATPAPAPKPDSCPAKKDGTWTPGKEFSVIMPIVRPDKRDKEGRIMSNFISGTLLKGKAVRTPHCGTTVTKKYAASKTPVLDVGYAVLRTSEALVDALGKAPAQGWQYGILAHCDSNTAVQVRLYCEANNVACPSVYAGQNPAEKYDQASKQPGEKRSAYQIALDEVAAHASVADAFPIGG